VPDCYTCRTLPKFILGLTEFTGQGTGPTGRLPTDRTQERREHTSTHTPCKLRSQDPRSSVVTKSTSHRFHTNSDQPAKVFVFYIRRPKYDGLDRSLMEFYWLYTLYLSTT